MKLPQDYFLFLNDKQNELNGVRSWFMEAILDVDKCIEIIPLVDLDDELHVLFLN